MKPPPAPLSPFAAVAEFADGERRIFTGADESAVYNAICAYAAAHNNDLACWSGVTDLHYNDGRLVAPCPARFPDRIVIDVTGYNGPLDENGLPLPLTNSEV